MAACGTKVSKHGNRSASGNVGSADFLEGLLDIADIDGARVRPHRAGNAN